MSNKGLYIVGAERSGKTTLARHFLRQKWPQIVVNPGYDEKGVKIFIDKGKLYNIDGKQIDIKKLLTTKVPILIDYPDDVEATNDIFWFIENLAGGGFVLFDDCREIFKHAIKRVGKVIRRKNHITTAGRRGVDMAFLYHANNRLSSEVLTLCQYAFIFRHLGDANTGDKGLDTVMKQIKEKLTSDPQYSFYQLNTLTKAYTGPHILKVKTN